MPGDGRFRELEVVRRRLIAPAALVAAALCILADGSRAQQLSIDVDPNAAGTVSAGLREALAQCPVNGDIYGNCILQLRCNTTYTLGARSSWDSDAAQNNYSGQATDAIDVLNLTNYDNVEIAGCDLSSRILYTGPTSSAYTYTHLLTSSYRSLPPFDRGSQGLRLRRLRLSWLESCANSCGADQQMFAFTMPDDVIVEDVYLEASQAVHTGNDTGDTGPTIGTFAGSAAFTPDTYAHAVRFLNNKVQIARQGLILDGCQDCIVSNNHWNKLGVPINDPGGTVTRFIGIANGVGIEVIGNDFDMDENGDNSLSIRNYGIEHNDGYSGANSAGGSQHGQPFGAIIEANTFYGMRRDGDRAIGLIGGSGTLITGNVFHGGQCTGDSLYSCRTDEECSAQSKGTCGFGRGAGVMWNLAYPAAPRLVTQMSQVTGNQFLRFDDFDESGDNYSMNCPMKIQGPFVPPVDPNDVQNLLITNNLFYLSDPNDDGFCGDPATWASSKNTIFGNKVVGGSVVGVDTDGDGVADTADNCPTVENPDQADYDFDGVGDACDNCVIVANPRVTPDASAFLASNPWATLTGDQRDDDHDGYGNRCDAHFTSTSGLVGTGDLTQFRASNGKNRTGDTCGTSGTEPCARYDLDEVSVVIDSGDLVNFRALTGKPPGPKCPTCPLPCRAGTAGSCDAIP